jgi:hypothetical protein
MLYDEDFPETLFFFFAINGSSLLHENGRLARREEEFHSSEIRRNFQCRQGAITILNSEHRLFFFSQLSNFYFSFKYFVGLGIGCDLSLSLDGT